MTVFAFGVLRIAIYNDGRFALTVVNLGVGRRERPYAAIGRWFV